MRWKLWVTTLFLTIRVGIAVSQSPPQPQPQSQPMGSAEMHHGTHPPGPTGPLKITFGDKSAEWTPNTLAALPHSTLTVYNEHAKASQIYSGVPLIDLLTRLGVPDKPRGKEFRLYPVAEVTPDVHDGTVIVADAQDGKPIAEDGPLKLVAAGEKRPARWVRNLVAIRV